jgi:hypothetical protein
VRAHDDDLVAALDLDLEIAHLSHRGLETLFLN